MSSPFRRGDARRAAPPRPVANGPGRAIGSRPRIGELLRLAWPAALSYLLNNAYRINDQFWIRGLGGEAQAALGALLFVLIMVFAFLFLAAGGTLALVSRATGAQDPAGRDATARHALFLATCLGLVLTLAGPALAPLVVGLLGLSGETALLAEAYLTGILLWSLPLALVPTVDNVFIGIGDTLTPMRLLLLAVLLNYVLNPLLIYGGSAAEAMPGAPLAPLLADIGERLGLEGFGVRGAAYATGASRLVTASLGLLLLRTRRGVRFLGSARLHPARLLELMRIATPVSISIGVYAGVYWVLLGAVLSRLPSPVTAGLGLGFTVFEGLAFPCYLGVAIAGASLVGRSLGARDPDGAREVVASARVVGRVLGLTMTALFLTVAPLLVPAFAAGPEVARETLLYVGILAFSQYWVAVEAVNEKVLLGAGHTRPILWISLSGNLLRIPLALFLALALGWGGPGVWWAITATTWYKAGLYWWIVQRGAWTRALLPAEARMAG